MKNTKTASGVNERRKTNALRKKISVEKTGQILLLKKGQKSYGGDLLKTRKARAEGRPLSTKSSMHLVLRSTKARGAWSFRSHKNSKKIKEIIKKFSDKYGVKVYSLANVGNHLHLHIQLSRRHTYRPFIRAVTSAIAMAVTGVNRWTKAGQEKAVWSKAKLKFWDRRPFTRILNGFKDFLTLNNYIAINRYEGYGVSRAVARMMLAPPHEGLRIKNTLGARVAPW